MTKLIFKTLGQVKKFIVAVIGITLLLVGVAMIILPGPAFVVIPLALAVLATEFVWAKKLLDKVKARIQNMKANNSKTPET